LERDRRPNIEHFDASGSKSQNDARRRMTSGARICQSDPKLFFNLHLNPPASHGEIEPSGCTGEKDLNIVLIFQGNLVTTTAKRAANTARVVVTVEISQRLQIVYLARGRGSRNPNLTHR
jgi:hypothetical protein